MDGDNKLKISIKQNTGATIDIEITGALTVKEVKTIIAEKSGIAAE